MIDYDRSQQYISEEVRLTIKGIIAGLPYSGRKKGIARVMSPTVIA
jgi:hypothetical protein